MSLRSFAAAALLLVTAPAVHAQSEEAPLLLPDPLTLDSALELFRTRGLDLLIADAAVAGAEGDVRIAGAVPNPNWSLFPAYTFSPPVHNPSSGALNGPWGVTAGIGDSNALEDSLSGKRWLRLRVAGAALAAARMNRVDAQRTLELAVKSAYITAVQGRDNLDFALQVQAGANQIFQLNQTRYKAGAISEADLAKVETMKLEADQSVDLSVQALRAAKVQLAFLLGVRGRVPDYKVDQDLPKFRVPEGMVDASAESLVGTAFAHRPDLKALGFQRDRALAGIALAKRQRFPDLGLNVQYTQQAGSDNTASQPPTISLRRHRQLAALLLAKGRDQEGRGRLPHAAAAARQGRGAAGRRCRGRVQRLRLDPQAARAHGGAAARSRQARSRAGVAAISEGRRVAARVSRRAAHLHRHQRRISSGPRELLDRRLSARSGDRNGSTMKLEAALSILVAAGVGGCGTHSNAATQPSPPAGEAWLTTQQVKNANLVVQPVGDQDVGGAVVTSGKVTFDDLRVSHVFSPVTGRVVRIEAQPGQRVKKGQPLAVIESPDVGNAFSDLAKAHADLTAAEHDYSGRRSCSTRMPPRRRTTRHRSTTGRRPRPSWRARRRRRRCWRVAAPTR